MSFSPAVGAAVTRSMFKPNASSSTPGTSSLTFVLQGGQGLSSTQLQGALGVMDVNDGTDNYFALPSSYDATTYQTTLLVDPSTIEPSSTLKIGIAIALANGQNQGGKPALLQWDDSIPAFINTPANYCPSGSSGSRTLVLIHGIYSSVQDSFGMAGGAAACASASGTSCPAGRGPYDTVLGINYGWTDDINTSAQSIVKILNSLFDSDLKVSPCKYQGSFDIEAHSEGTVVTLATAQTGAGYLNSNTESKLKHVVLVAGPIDGTPVASKPMDYLTYYLNSQPPNIADLIPVAVSTYYPFINGLRPDSTILGDAKAEAQQTLASSEIIAVGGDKPYLDQWWQTLFTQSVLLGIPNDGVIPVSSALPTDSSLPNLVRLVGNDPNSGDYPYPYNHTHLVDNSSVIRDILNALNGGGETAQVSLNITPPSATLAPGQAITLTANVANMLNPQLLWSISGGTASGSLNTTQGRIVEYTAPSSPGGPFEVSATILAVPVTFAPAQITVSLSTGEVTISPSSATVPVAAAQTFSAIVIGGGSVNWTVEEGNSGGIVTSAGIYSAPSQRGTYHVIATNSADATQSAMATVNVIAGPSVTTIHSFSHATGGAVPWSAPMFGSDGNLYGVTEAGGNLSCVYITSLEGCGTIYKSDTSGSVTTLHSFSGLDGAYPVASLKQTTNSTFYGSTDYGGSNTSECIIPGTSTQSGCGSVFSFDLTNGFASIFSFGPFTSPLGAGPAAAFTQDSSGILYGANEVGGNSSCAGFLGAVSEAGCGSIFTINSSNVVSAVHTFAGTEGAFPSSGPILQPDGNFYGTTLGGGVSACSSYAKPGCGTVFQMSSTGTIKTLHSFTQQDGASPEAQLIVGSDGKMYGTTLFGGPANCSGGAPWQGCGAVFRIDASGNFTLLHKFSGIDGAYPAQLMQATDGYFYGTTEGGGNASCAGRYGPGCGTVFRMDWAGNVTVLYAFTGQSDGSWPESAVVQGADGNLYGTTAYGGVNDDGVIFRISNLASLSPSASKSGIEQNVRPIITPVLVRRPHVGIPLPGFQEQP
jgi:uncharacterized repeat protein (TIGR03803 family)